MIATDNINILRHTFQLLLLRQKSSIQENLCCKFFQRNILFVHLLIQYNIEIIWFLLTFKIRKSFWVIPATLVGFTSNATPSTWYTLSINIEPPVLCQWWNIVALITSSKNEIIDQFNIALTSSYTTWIIILFTCKFISFWIDENLKSSLKSL